MGIVSPACGGGPQVENLRHMGRGRVHLTKGASPETTGAVGPTAGNAGGAGVREWCSPLRGRGGEFEGEGEDEVAVPRGVGVVVFDPEGDAFRAYGQGAGDEAEEGGLQIGRGEPGVGALREAQGRGLYCGWKSREGRPFSVAAAARWCGVSRP